jgi:DNA-binding transcriptional regulator LsrR (DeoR family)
MYYFGGFAQKEVAELLGLSQPTVVEDLRFARAWLARLWGE